MATLAIMAILAIRLAAADTITGTVHNQTTGQPAAGDDVVLLKLADRMQEQEQARSKTDRQGVFTFNETDAKTVYVVRVFHQGVNYDRNVTGVNPLEVKVFDAVSKIAGLSGSGTRFRATHAQSGCLSDSPMSGRSES